MPVNVATVSPLIEPAMRKQFGLGRNQVVAQMKRIFKVTSTKDPMIEIVESGGPGPLRQKTENAAVEMGEVYVGPVKRFNAITFAGGLQVSFEALEDLKSKAPELSRASRALGTSTSRTPEYLAAQYLGRAFNASFPATPDRLPLCSTAHVLPNGALAANMPTGIQSSFCESAIEEMKTANRTQVGPHGMLEPRLIRKIVVPSALANAAEKLRKNPKTTGSAMNDPSVIQDVMEDYVVFDFLASQTAYFGLTDIPEDEGLWWKWRHEPEFMEDNSGSTLTALFIAFFRAMWGVVDWRAIWGVNAS